MRDWLRGWLRVDVDRALVESDILDCASRDLEAMKRISELELRIAKLEATQPRQIVTQSSELSKVPVRMKTMKEFRESVEVED